MSFSSQNTNMWWLRAQLAVSSSRSPKTRHRNRSSGTTALYCGATKRSLKVSFRCFGAGMAKRKHTDHSASQSLHTTEEKRCKYFATTKRLSRNFYSVPCNVLANSLLGKILVRKLGDGTVLKGRIVETECYPGGEDKASHSYHGRRTPRNEPMYMQPGTSYVYITYGMYHCFNISSEEPGGAVLVRAVEPVEGLDAMIQLRNRARKKNSKPVPIEETTNGPSKLCTAMSITKDECNALDLCTSDVFYVEEDDESSSERCVVSTKRIGIESAGPYWAGRHLRFYVFGNVHVSRRDVRREKEVLQYLFTSDT